MRVKNRCKPGESGCCYGSDSGQKEQAPLSPGESAPADRALVSVELLESDLAECGCLYCGACILSTNGIVRSGELATVAMAGPSHDWRYLAPPYASSASSPFTVNAVLTTESTRGKKAQPTVFSCDGAQCYGLIHCILNYRNHFPSEAAARQFPKIVLPLTSWTALK